MFVKYVLPAASLALLTFAAWRVWGLPQPSAEAPPPIEPPQSPFDATVAGAGILEARTENIFVGSPLAGVVVEVFVEVGQAVRAGDPLFALDDRQLKAEMRDRQAALAAAKAELARLEAFPRPEQVPVAEAAVNRAKAELADRQDLLTRIRPLAEQKIATQQELVRAEQAVLRAKALLEQAEAELALLNAGTWNHDKLVARAAIEQAQAHLDATATEVDRLTVRALVAGEVLLVNVRPGEYVATPAPDPLILLGDVSRLHVRVDIDEHDIPRFRAGSPAKAVLRGAVGRQFALSFVRIEPFVIPKRSLTGDNTERVDTRVLQVIYALDGQDEGLFVGQQLDVFIEAGKGEATGPSP
jgi:multidrug resistance efflux pump